MIMTGLPELRGSPEVALELVCTMSFQLENSGYVVVLFSRIPDSHAGNKMPRMHIDQVLADKQFIFRR